MLRITWSDSIFAVHFFYTPITEHARRLSFDFSLSLKHHLWCFLRTVPSCCASPVLYLLNMELLVIIWLKLLRIFLTNIWINVLNSRIVDWVIYQLYAQLSICDDLIFVVRFLTNCKECIFCVNSLITSPNGSKVVYFNLI